MSDDKELLATARKRYDYVANEDSDNRKFQRDDAKFYLGSPDNGWQWPESVRQKRETGNRPMLTINKLPQHVHQITNEQRQNRPAIKVLPVDDKADPKTSEVIAGICRHIEANSDADIAYDTGGENQVSRGIGYWRVLTDYVDDQSFDQDIMIKAIPDPDVVDLDPDIEDPCGADAKWGFISKVLIEEDFKAEYPKAKPIDWDAAKDSTQDKWFPDGKKVRIAEYFYIENEEKKLYALADGSVVDKLPEGQEAVRERTVRVPKVKWCKLTGQEVLDKREWVGKYLPIVRCVGNEYFVDGKRIVFGHVRNQKDPQRMYNYWTSLEAELYALAPKAPFIMAEGQAEGHEDEWANANQDNLAYLTYKQVTEGGVSAPPPQRQQPILPQAGLIQAKMGASEDLKGVSAQYNASLGQKSNETSGVAIRNRNKESDTANFHYIDNQARAIRHTGRILIDLIPKIYDTRRIARILGEDGEPDQVVIDPSQQQAMTVQKNEQGKIIDRIYNPSLGKYDVRATAGPSYTTARQEATEFMADVVRGNPQLMQVIGDLYFGMMDVPGADQIAKRLKKTLPPQLAQDDENVDEQTVDAKLAQVHAGEQQQQAMGQQLEQRAQLVQKKEHELAAQEQKVQADMVKVDADHKILVADYNRMQAMLKAAEAEALLKGVLIPEGSDNLPAPQSQGQPQQSQAMVSTLQRLLQQVNEKNAPSTSEATIAEQPDGSMRMRKVENGRVSEAVIVEESPGVFKMHKVEAQTVH